LEEESEKDKKEIEQKCEKKEKGRGEETFKIFYLRGYSHPAHKKV